MPVDGSPLLHSQNANIIHYRTNQCDTELDDEVFWLDSTTSFTPEEIELIFQNLAKKIGSLERKYQKQFNPIAQSTPF